MWLQLYEISTKPIEPETYQWSPRVYGESTDGLQNGTKIVWGGGSVVKVECTDGCTAHKLLKVTELYIYNGEKFHDL